ncbi:MAG: hypothetical protein RR365_07220 [Bacteroides sp.]
MELNELKKSWNALGEHLKDKRLVDDEDIVHLMEHAKKNIREMSVFNQRINIFSFCLIAFFIVLFLSGGAFLDAYYLTILVALFPAIIWDIFSARFFAQTKIDEMPLVNVISRFNRIHRWVICERLISVAFMLFLAGFFFIYRRVWEHGFGMIVFFFVVWIAGFAIPLWVYRKNLGRLREIKKNLDELKELCIS